MPKDYRSKFLQSWAFEFPTFRKGETEFYAYCICCRRDISVAHNGKKSLYLHVNMPNHIKHLQMCQNTSIAKEIELNKRNLEKLAEENGWELVSEFNQQPQLGDQQHQLAPVESQQPPIVIQRKGKAKINFICPLCSEDQFTRSNLAEHLYLFHKQKVVSINRSFSLLEDFQTWKAATEKETNSYYFKDGKKFRQRNYFVQYYTCSKNRRKAVGDGTVIPFCPSEIKLMFDDAKVFTVEYRPDHMGHSTDDPNNDEEDVMMSDETITLSDDDDFEVFDSTKSKENILKFLGNLLDRFPDKPSHQRLSHILKQFERDSIPPK